MPWELNGNSGIGANHFLGTRNNAALIIKTNTGTAPANLEEVARVTPSSATARGRVGIGTANPQRALHVEENGIHCGGGASAYSFSNRETAAFVQNPAAGERWVWFASGGVARLWSGTEKLTVTPAGDVGIGIGTANPQRRLHVENTEIHSGGSIAGLSFGNRETPQFVNGPGAGERWVWYASGGRARLWSGNDKVMVTPAGEVGIGTANPQRRLHVENTEIHSGGSIAGLSFGNRETPQFVNGPGAGERWVWYASGGVARLWSGNDKVTVTTAGTLTATTKNFRISHPLDPERRFLIHACLEGSENAVYYRGQGRLEGGHARVQLPDYFEALARPDGRTVIVTSCCEENEPISVLAASGIVSGAFNVRAADDRNSEQSFYWEVKAVRADVEPLETEEYKAEGRSAAARGLAWVGPTGA